MRMAIAAIERSPALRDQTVIGGERLRIIAAFCTEYALSEVEVRIVGRLADATARDAR